MPSTRAEANLPDGLASSACTMAVVAPAGIESDAREGDAIASDA
jgi:hypothetical protein